MSATPTQRDLTSWKYLLDAAIQEPNRSVKTLCEIGSIRELAAIILRKMK